MASAAVASCRRPPHAGQIIVSTNSSVIFIVTLLRFRICPIAECGFRIKRITASSIRNPKSAFRNHLYAVLRAQGDAWLWVDRLIGGQPQPPLLRDWSDEQQQIG